MSNPIAPGMRYDCGIRQSLMKTKHRHDLKENDLALAVGSARQWIASNGQSIGAAIIAVIVVAGVALGIVAYRNREQAKGQDLLAEAMVVLNTAVVPVTANTQEPGAAPAAASIGATGTFSTETQKMNAALPKLRAAADAYPDTVAGVTARYHLASTLATLG